MKAKLIKLALHDGYRLDDENGLLIASTLESSKNKISLKNCQAIERGYDLDELAKTIFPDKIFTTDEEHEIPIDGSPYQWGFKVGFQKALELMGDKKFSEKDMEKSIEFGANLGLADNIGNSFEWSKKIKDHIQSQRQTEWDVEIEMVNTLENGYKNQPVNTIGFIAEHKSEPKLDENGCLILKRI